MNIIITKDNKPIEDSGTERFFIDLQGKVREVLYLDHHLSLHEREDLSFIIEENGNRN